MEREIEGKSCWTWDVVDICRPHHGACLGSFVLHHLQLLTYNNSSNSKNNSNDRYNSNTNSSSNSNNSSNNRYNN